MRHIYSTWSSVNTIVYMHAIRHIYSTWVSNSLTSLPGQKSNVAKTPHTTVALLLRHPPLHLIITLGLHAP